MQLQEICSISENLEREILKNKKKQESDGSRHHIKDKNTGKGATMVAKKNLTEIDAIFATRGTSKANTSVNKSKDSTVVGRFPGPSNGTGLTKGGRRRGTNEVQGETTHSKLPQQLRSNQNSKRRAEHEVELILDPSQAILNPPPHPDSNLKNKKKKVNSNLDVDDEQERAFRDSRGTRPKTEDGLMIYSVEELKIGLGLDTPECPFDCQCCKNPFISFSGNFSSVYGNLGTQIHEKKLTSLRPLFLKTMRSSMVPIESGVQPSE
ncbi:hypothetical protein MJO29_003014 [Puccinia striiformis f. sp. tritici]|nr:hypothetical protein MJO29_003014 [Puccinia striiformis f. sp. tritici]